MRILFVAILAIAGFVSSSAQAEMTACTEITALPGTISVPGNYCFKKHLSTNAPSGPAITIAANHVTIDLNGYKLGGAGAGSASTATGIVANNFSFLTIRNGVIKGFQYGIVLNGGSANLVEDTQIDGSLVTGISISDGKATTVRNNRITNTGTPSIVNAYAISFFGYTVNRNNIASGNAISNVTATNYAVGIVSQDAKLLTITENIIEDINGNPSNTYGIYSFIPNFGSLFNRIIATNNTLFGTGIGSGIYLSTSGNICSDNKILYFQYGLPSGCPVSARNDVY